VAPEFGAWARARGVLQRVRSRWMPNGEQAAIAELVTPRPMLGPPARHQPAEQPLPLRALGEELVARLEAWEGRPVEVHGVLRRRYTRRDEAPYWGQVEIWIERIAPIETERKE